MTLFENQDIKNIKEDNPALRPLLLSDFQGQEKTIKKLEIAIAGAKSRNEILGHSLFYGPPGLGKTTLAQIISNEMGGDFKTITAPMLQRPGDLASILVSLEENSIFFIDEIHRLHPMIEEILYPAMEDFRLDMLTGEAGKTTSISIDLSKFTLIGATTRSGALSRPLRDRFKQPYKLEPYTDEEMTGIIKRSAKLQNHPIDYHLAYMIAQRSRGTPRIGNRILGHIIDYVAWSQKENITEESIIESCNIHGIDENGLDERDREYLSCLKERYNGKPVGLETLSATLGEDKMTIQDDIEPYLIQKGFVDRTKKGRIYLNQKSLIL